MPRGAKLSFRCVAAATRPSLCMEAALNGIANSKHSATKEAVAQAREALKNQKEKGDVPIPYVREKCLAAIELAFDHGNEKCSHAAVEGVQALLRDQRFQSLSSEKPEHNLPTQILHSMTGIEQWNHQLQCHCLTLLVEMVCTSELKVSLSELEETLELCMRVYGGSKEESVRVSARAAISQSISSYFENRYGQAEESQDQIAVFFDVSKVLEAYVAKLDQLTTSNDQSVVVFDATNALLSSQPLAIQKYQPFINLLWEKLCPLMIRLLGVPDKNVTSSSVSVSAEEPVGQGQINKFPLSPAVISNPEATRALYSILEQLIRIMAGIGSVSPVLEALFHKAFLFPKIEQRTEAVRVIRKIVSCPKRISDLVTAATRTRSLSLWRMLIVCLLESANPAYEISIDAVRSCGAMLQGVLDFSRSTQLLDQDSRQILNEMFSNLQNATVSSFTARSDVGSCSPRPSTDTQPTPTTKEPEGDVEDEMSETLKKLTAKFGMEGQSTGESPKKIQQRRSTEYDETSEKVTAQKFVDALTDKLPEWTALRSTLAIDEAILEFAAAFYSDFSAVHNEVFKSKSKIQQEFLNTDAIYLTAHASLSLALRGQEKMSATKFKESVLSSGCIVYVSDSWLQKVYDHLVVDCPKSGIDGALKDVICDYDGLDRKLLSDWRRLQRISRGSQSDLHPYEERLAARWFITAAWSSIVHILSTFLGVKERRRARPKVLQGAEHAINGVQKLATVALELELGERCGWIFENLVEASCDVEELRTTATTEEQKRWSIVSRLDLLSIEMVLDNAFVGVHALECWKHVIRCTEFVWELEKYIYGALCYEKPSRFSFGKKKKEMVENKAEEGLSCADRSVEVAIGDKELDRDNMNKALAVLIAKVDRFYSECGRKLCLRALRELLVALVGASENRILYSNQKAPALAPAVNLIARISEILTPMPNRPLVHQMLIWPIVGSHFIQIAPCGEESRSAVEALSEAAASMLMTESNGLCFNQMLLAPFQAIVCMDSCSSETREQLVSALSDYVKTKFDTLGSGWKPLFGTLRAVRTSTVEDASVHWTVLDVIGSYLRIRRSSVLSWSLPDCFPCIFHFLQSRETEASEIDEQLSEAALHLVQPTYSVILNLFQTPHIPNHNLLHRADLRSANEEEVETRIVCQESTASWLPPLSAGLDPTFYAHDPDEPEATEMDRAIDVPRGPLPWKNLETHAIASTELLLSFVDQLVGTLVTAPQKVQPPLLTHIQTLMTSVKQSAFGVETASFCVSTLVLPMAQKWLRRGNYPDEGRNLKQAIGTCTQIVLDLSDGLETSPWSTRLLSDICRLAVECCAQPGDLSRVGAACLRHVATIASKFDTAQWTIFEKAIWDASVVTLHPIRLLTAQFVCDTDEGGRLRTDGTGPLPPKIRMMAQQVFQMDSQRSISENGQSDSEEYSDIDLIFEEGGLRVRIPVSLLISSLLTHQLILQLIANILSPIKVPLLMRKILVQGPDEDLLGKLDKRTISHLFYTLDASFQTAREVDSRAGVALLIAKTTGLSHPNLFKQFVSSGLIKLHTLFQLHQMTSDIRHMDRLCHCLERIVTELQRLEKKAIIEKLAVLQREYKQETLEFMLVEEDGEKLYKIVTQQDIDSTLADYQRQKPLGTQPAKERKNPFTEALSQENNSSDTSQLDDNALRLISYREVCLTPIHLILGEPEPDKLLKPLLPAIKRLLLASPDLSVRSLAIQLLDLYTS